MSKVPERHGVETGLVDREDRLAGLLDYDNKVMGVARQEAEDWSAVVPL